MSVKVVENGKETKSIAATFNEGNQLENSKRIVNV